MTKEEIVVSLAVLGVVGGAALISIWTQGWLLEFLMPRVYIP